MKKLLFITLFLLAVLGSKAQTMQTTQINESVDLKYQVINTYVKEMRQQIANLRTQDAVRGDTTNRAVSRAFVKDLVALRNTYKPLFTIQDTTIIEVDSLQIMSRIDDLKIKIKNLKACEDCDSISLNSQIKEYRKQKNKLEGYSENWVHKVDE